MKKYRKKEEILVWFWDGDKSIIGEINKILENLYEDEFKVGISNDEKVLGLSQKLDDKTWTEWVHIGEFIVFDKNNNDTPITSYGERLFNNKFIEL